jgi:predicted  nucleic acid-binding Zn-ribbon protein
MTQTIEEAAAKYANDYDGMQWEKDRIEIAFIKGAQSQSREIEELQASKENLIKIAEQFQKNASEITKECFKLKNEITDLKAEIERLKGENFKELESKFRNGC